MGGGSSSPVDTLRTDLEAFEAGAPTPAQAKSNKAKSRADILDFLIPRDAYEMTRDTARAAKDEGAKGAAREGALSALEVLGIGAPISRTAAKVAKSAPSSAGVFVPAPDLPITTRARQMRAEGVAPDRIWRETQRLIGPEGRVRRELPDSDMFLRSGLKPGDTMPLAEGVSHPRLFRSMPELSERTLRITDEIDASRRPVNRTTPEGDFVINPRGEDARYPLSKLLQYEIDKSTGAPAALRHGPRAVEQGLDSAATRADAIDLPPDIRGEVDAYLEHVAEAREQFRMLREQEQYTRRGPTSPAAEKIIKRNAGNTNAIAAASRVFATPDELGAIWPYAKQAPYRTGQNTVMPAFGDQLVLPPDSLNQDELLAFIRDWRTLGSGRK